MKFEVLRNGEPIAAIPSRNFRMMWQIVSGEIDIGIAIIALRLNAPKREFDGSFTVTFNDDGSIVYEHHHQTIVFEMKEIA